MLNQATGQSQRRTTDEDPRLEEIKRLARAARDGHLDDKVGAVQRLRRVLREERPDLGFFLVNDAFERATWAEIERLEWGSAGVRMQQNAKAERSSHPVEPMDEATRRLRLQRKRAGQAEWKKTSLLLTFQVEGRALGFCTKHELVKKAESNETDARFLRAIAGLLPSDSDMVRDHVTDKQAEDALKKARAAA